MGMFPKLVCFKCPKAYSLQGTLENGESRLLFSSKQVEYMRYWLHAVGFTESLLPLPSSQYLLTESSLKTTSPVTYKTGAELKTAVKVCTYNK